MITVVRGNPTPEELAAALTVVQARIAAAASAAARPPRRRTPPWSDPARTTPGTRPHPGPGSWRTSFWPA
ncbi:acyl-CoA carboxylase subunit epsilon [Streptomyces sp. RFCAC02]|uniref:acyl-CoA carboxylase subunit epsilon n=1 Tax=Streptomyces sp. RFCAC02 TaxID=2499143 RepID=UPI00101F89A5|nr:acyl-CoA carboxylase subunit epsilon [Streptomyces sp. RFCAC02]